MAINNITGFPGSANARRVDGGGNGAGRTETGNQPAAGAPQGDRVDLTDTSARLQAIERSLADVPVVDEQRVDAIRQSIADGSYEVSPERVADGLLQMEKDLGG